MFRIKIPKKLLSLLIFFGGLKILIHIIANSNYGLHADELYYISLSKHLQWGYLDNSPFIAFITKISSFLFGESTFAYRIFPTLFSVLTVFVTGLMAYRLGGKSTAIAITCLAMIFSPAYLATSYFLQPIVFEQFFWTLIAFLLLMFLQTSKTSFLYGLAATAAVGFLNKYTIILFLFSLLVGLVFSKRLQQFKWKALLVSSGIFLIIIFPNILWQAQHGFPIFNYLGIVKSETHFIGFGEYIFQFTFFHAAGVAVWLTGFLFLFLSKNYQKYTFFSIAFIVVLCVLLALKGKIYYGLGAFPVLFAAGGVCWETMLNRISKFYKIAFYLILIAPSLVALPIVVPILPFNLTHKYLALMTKYTNIYQPLQWEDGKIHSLPQIYADMLGWQELAAKVEKTFAKLPGEQQKNTVILTDKYFVAGALHHYLKSGGQKVISPNNSFALWSPAKLNAKKVVYISLRADSDVAKYAKHIISVDSLNYPYSRINGAHIYLLDHPSVLFKDLYKDERERFMR